MGATFPTPSLPSPPPPPPTPTPSPAPSFKYPQIPVLGTLRQIIPIRSYQIPVLRHNTPVLACPTVQQPLSPLEALAPASIACCSAEEKAIKISRWLLKRKRRVWTRRGVNVNEQRKAVSKKRQRVEGRFASTS